MHLNEEPLGEGKVERGKGKWSTTSSFGIKYSAQSVSVCVGSCQQEATYCHYGICDTFFHVLPRIGRRFGELYMYLF